MSTLPLQLDISPQEAIDILCRMALRAEKTSDQKRFFPSYVPIISLSLLHNPNTQILFGRNGTGKTHILRTYAEYCSLSYHDNRTIPVYFDMRLLDVSRVAGTLSPQEIAIRYYTRFIKHLIDKVDIFVDENIQDNVLAIFSKHPKGNRSRARAAIKRIRRVLDESSIEERISNRVERYHSQTTNRTHDQAKMKASAVDLTAELAASDERQRIRSVDVEASVEAVDAIDFSTIRDALEELISDVGARSISVLIDEWAQIDREVQPIIAEFLRRTLCVSNKIHLKIAALKYLTSLSVKSESGTTVGFQFGVDITELTDLNRIYTLELDTEAVRRFLLYILLKHFLDEVAMRHEIDLDKTTVVLLVDKIADLIFSKVFDGIDIFEYFVRASEGNPRDFLSIIGECCASNRQHALPITKNRVTHSAVNHFTNVKTANFPQSATGALATFNKIFEFCAGQKSKVFTISANLVHESNDINELWHQRIIHLIEREYSVYSADSTILTYSLFTIDYGKLISLRNQEVAGPLVEDMVRTAQRIIRKISNDSQHEQILEDIEINDVFASQVKDHVEGVLATSTYSVIPDTEEFAFDDQKLIELCVDHIIEAK